MRGRWRIDWVGVCFIQAFVQIIGFLIAVSFIYAGRKPDGLEHRQLLPWRYEFETQDELPGCFHTTFLPLETTKESACVSRRAHDYMLPCGIGLIPNVSKNPHVLVIGSTGLLGLAITAELKSREFQVAQMRSHFQFDISVPTMYEMLKQINVIAVINLAHNTTWAQENFTLDRLHIFCKSRSIPILQPVKEFGNYKHTIQIKVGPVWGPSLMVINPNSPGRQIAECFRNRKTVMTSTNNYVFSADVAQFIVNILVDRLEGKVLQKQIIAPEMPVTTTAEIARFLRENGCKVSEIGQLGFRRNAKPDPNARERFAVAWEFCERQAVKRYRPYASYVVVVSNKPRLIDLHSRVLAYFTEILALYPGIPLEIVTVYCPSDDARGKFYRIFNVSKRLKPFISLYEVPASYVESRKVAHNISYFPEFDMKNVGIRRANGEYIFSTNADVVPPPGFFESVYKRAFSPLSYIRSRRLGVVPTPLRYGSLAHDWLSRQNWTAHFQQLVDVCGDRRYYDQYERDACGDFQGAHQEMWLAIHGFLESEHVFHVDTGVGLDFSAFPAQIYARLIGYNIHFEHAKESKATSHFKFYNDTIKNAIRHGVMTQMLERYRRDDWGGKGWNFVSY
jgi:hypothetical protein